MSESSKHAVLTRREALILSAGAGVAITTGKFARASDSIKTAAHQEPGNVSTPRSAIAKTRYGKMRGFLDSGVFTFKGVPYAQTTAGENRWLPAKPPVPWTDEYPALAYGGNCPQNLHPWTSIEQTFLGRLPFSTAYQGHGTRLNFNSASTTRSAANKERAIHRKRKCWQERWRHPGRHSRQRETRAFRV
jgi:Carboxylesterase family